MTPRNSPPDDEGADHDQRIVDLLLLRQRQLIEESVLHTPLLKLDSSSATEETAIEDASLLDEASELEECLLLLEQARREESARDAKESEQPTDKNSPPSDDHLSDSSHLFEEYLNHLDESDGNSLATAPSGALLEKQQIGRFKIVRELGRGGLGLVLLANDPLLRRQVALKVPKPEVLFTPNLRHRFRREAMAAARLTHPGIVPVYEVGEAGPIMFIAAAFIEGKSLAASLHELGRPDDPRIGASIIADLADAMHYAHSQGVLHRDLKPANVLIEPRPVDAPSTEEKAASATAITSWNDPRTVKITDFGLAKIIDLAGDETRSGAIIGTPAYMAPEQAKADLGQIGPLADVYALGAILYELLTGDAPFRAPSDAEMLRLVVSEEPVPPRQLNPLCPRDLEAICLKCLEKSPTQRYQSAGELAVDLRRFLAGEPTIARPLSMMGQVIRWAGRNRSLAVMLSAVVLLLLGVAIVSTVAAVLLNKAWKRADENAHSEWLAREEAQQLRERSEKQLFAHMERNYATEIASAYHSADNGEYSAVTRSLELFKPVKGIPDVRGWEWHYLNERNEEAKSFSSHLRQITGDGSPVYCVQFTNQGGELYFGTKEGNLFIHDSRDFKLANRIHAHNSCINSITLSRDATRVITTSCDKTAILWDTANWRRIAELTFDTEVWTAQYAPDGGTFVLCSNGLVPNSSELRLCNSHTGEVIAKWKANQDINRLVFLDERTLVGANLAGKFTQWNMSRSVPDEGEPAISKSPVVPRPYRNGLIWSPDLRHLAYFSIDGGAHSLGIFDTLTRHSRHFSHGGYTDMRGAFSPDGRMLVLPHGGLQMEIRALITGAQLGTLVGHRERIENVTISPDSKIIATASSDGTVNLYSIKSPKLFTRNFKEGHYVTSISTDMKRAFLIQLPGDALEVIDLSQYALLARYETIGEFPFSELYVHNVSHNERWALFATRPHAGNHSIEDRTLLLFDLKLRRIVWRGPAHSWLSTFSHDDRFVCVLSNSSISIIDTQTGKVFSESSLPAGYSPSGNCHQIEFSHDDESIIFANVENTTVANDKCPCFIYHLSNRSLSDFGEGCHGICFSLTGQYAVKIGVGIEERCELVDSISGKLIRTLSCHHVSSASFSPDGRTIAICCGDGFLRLSHTTTGQELLTLGYVGNGPTSARFSVDGKRIVAWSSQQCTYSIFPIGKSEWD
ncbi:protein kinase [bacterium]|nr:protein kinase [bacterium]